MDMKSIPMTDEYAARYFHKMGWMWGRLEVMKEEKTWGNLKEKRIEKELRAKISQEIEDKRTKYLELANNKESEDYQFYLGVCNGMNFAKVIVENPK
jgi:hypothetical protein